jgi:hypothetical protein
MSLSYFGAIAWYPKQYDNEFGEARDRFMSISFLFQHEGEKT